MTIDYFKIMAQMQTKSRERYETALQGILHLCNTVQGGTVGRDLVKSLCESALEDVTAEETTDFIEEEENDFEV